jgi:MoaA/NifB/PqqE/SkfB family radical SAM enzyme
VPSSASLLLSAETSTYGFQGRLSSKFPSQLLVDATEICNLACVHCPHPIFKKSEHYDGRSVNPELNAKLVDEVRVHGKGHTLYIRYASNGEPLTHPHIYEMLDYAKRHSGAMVTLTTNGKLMVESRIERLLNAGVDVIDISLDAFSPEVYTKVRVGGNLLVTRANVLRLIALIRERRASTKVVVSYVEQPLNRHETDDFERFWKDAGANYVVVRRLHSCSGANPELAEQRRVENDAAGPRRPCLYPWERIVLNARGDLSFCPSDWVHGSFITDYRTTTIKEVWQGEFYRRLREAHLSNNYSCHGFCGQCPDWKSTRWPVEGRSYANMMEEFKALE